MRKILLVEDDASFGSVLKSYLELHNYDVTLCNDGSLGYSAFKKYSFDLCILDIMMPNKDGFTLAKEIKGIDKAKPLIFLTAKSLKEDMLKGFEIGADDYITKPFDSEILLHKIKAILKRNLTNTLDSNLSEFNIGNYYFNSEQRTLMFNNLEYRLSPKESDLLKLLCLNINNILTRSEALTKIWGNDNYFNGRSMDVYIAKLRKYLEQDLNVEIVNIHRKGFKLMIYNNI